MGTKSDRAKMVIVLRALHVRRFVMRLMRIKRRERNVVMDVVDLMIEKNYWNWNQIDTYVGKNIDQGHLICIDSIKIPRK